MRSTCSSQYYCRPRSRKITIWQAQAHSNSESKFQIVFIYRVCSLESALIGLVKRETKHSSTQHMNTQSMDTTASGSMTKQVLGSVNAIKKQVLPVLSRRRTQTRLGKPIATLEPPKNPIKNDTIYVNSIRAYLLYILDYILISIPTHFILYFSFYIYLK